MKIFKKERKLSHNTGPNLRKCEENYQRQIPSFLTEKSIKPNHYSVLLQWEGECENLDKQHKEGLSMLKLKRISHSAYIMFAFDKSYLLWSVLVWIKTTKILRSVHFFFFFDKANYRDTSKNIQS